MEDIQKMFGPDTVALITKYGTSVIGALVLLVVALMVSGWARSLTEKGLQRVNFDATLTKFFSSFARWVVLLVAIIGILGIFGVETTSFAAVLGSAGLAVGLAFQGSLSNIAAGVMLLTFRPFKVGDGVKVAGQVGRVDEISLFSTSLITPDNRHIIIPNGSVFGSVIENMTQFETRRVDVAVGTDYSADVDETRRVLEACIKNIPGVLSEPAPQVFLSALGGSSVDWQVRVWTHPSKYWDVWQATTREVKYALDGAEIGIPFPQMDVHIDHVNAPPKD